MLYFRNLDPIFFDLITTIPIVEESRCAKKNCVHIDTIAYQREVIGRVFPEQISKILIFVIGEEIG